METSLGTIEDQSPIGDGAEPGGSLGSDGARAEVIPFRDASALLGDRESMERVWEEHRRWVAGVLLAYMPKWADLEDLLQDVATAFVRKGHGIRDVGAVRPWLRTVAINMAHAAARSARSRPSQAMGGDEERPIAEGLSSDHRAAPEQIGDRQQGVRLMKLAAELPDGYREPLLLKAIQGLSYREIGRILDLPETTVETRIARARKQLRELASRDEKSAGVTP
jgi:RNA polymerase sigma-70 factor, ECF subfamily